MVSNKCIYALRAVLELAKREKQGRVPISEIARVQGIPPRFLETILRQLKQGGLTESTRGKDGGYQLARPASRITVADVIALFEEPLDSGTDGEGPFDVFDNLWHDAQAALESVYAKTDFGTLVRREQEAINAQPNNYSI